jgi:hypothetical protein
MSKWELKIAENAGELRALAATEELSVPTDKLFIDMKAQLMFVPKNFSWTVGWRSYVWQEKETGRFKDLSQDEYNTLLNEGTVAYSRDDDRSSNESKVDTSNEGSNPQ